MREDSFVVTVKNETVMKKESNSLATVTKKWRREN